MEFLKLATSGWNYRDGGTHFLQNKNGTLHGQLTLLFVLNISYRKHSKLEIITSHLNVIEQSMKTEGPYYFFCF